MKSLGLYGLYESKMFLLHEEVESLSIFLYKAFIRGRLSYMLVRKWQLDFDIAIIPMASWLGFIKSIPDWIKEFYPVTDQYPTGIIRRSIAFFLKKFYEVKFAQGYLKQKDLINEAQF